MRFQMVLVLKTANIKTKLMPCWLRDRFNYQPESGSEIYRISQHIIHYPTIKRNAF